MSVAQTCKRRRKQMRLDKRFRPKGGNGMTSTAKPKPAVKGKK